MAKALRNVVCVLCRKKTPEISAKRAFGGKSQTVPLWVCPRCYKSVVHA
jgi:hypothetical protein